MPSISHRRANAARLNTEDSTSLLHQQIDRYAEAPAAWRGHRRRAAITRAPSNRSRWSPFRCISAARHQRCAAPCCREACFRLDRWLHGLLWSANAEHPRHLGTASSRERMSSSRPRRPPMAFSKRRSRAASSVADITASYADASLPSVFHRTISIIAAFHSVRRRHSFRAGMASGHRLKPPKLDCHLDGTL